MCNITARSIKASEIKADRMSSAMKEVQELQQYRQIGTVEECRKARKSRKP